MSNIEEIKERARKELEKGNKIGFAILMSVAMKRKSRFER